MWDKTKRQEQRMLEDTARNAFFNKLQKDNFTEADVISSLDLIKIVAPGDDEAAHIMEKALWNRVLKELSINNPIAATALDTKNIEFSRWFA